MFWQDAATHLQEYDEGQLIKSGLGNHYTVNNLAIMKLAHGQSLIKQLNSNIMVDLDPFWNFYHKKLKQKSCHDILKISHKKSYAKSSKINFLPIYEINYLVDYIFGVAPKIPKSIGLNLSKKKQKP